MGASGHGAGVGEFRKPNPTNRKELANRSGPVGGLGHGAREGAEPVAAAEVDGFDAGDGEVRALGGEQGAEAVEFVVVFGDDLAKAAVGDAVGRLEAFEAAEGLAGGGGPRLNGDFLRVKW